MNHTQNIPSLSGVGLNSIEFLNRYRQTKKEVSHVQQTTKNVAELFVRRLKLNLGDDQGKALASVIPFNTFSKLTLAENHRSLVAHAFSTQVCAFSGGFITDDRVFSPLWLSLLLKGQGLRRMTTDTEIYSKRLMQLFGDFTPEQLSNHFVSEPWTAYRLGLFPHALKLIGAGSSTSMPDLSLRVRLAENPRSQDLHYEISKFNLNQEARIGILSALLAYSLKKKEQIPEFVMGELAAWLDAVKSNAITEALAPLVAQVMNSMNLFLLTRNDETEVHSNIDFLLKAVTPQISLSTRRQHIEGNAWFQKSILARISKETNLETTCILKAMDLDSHFSTLYYRMAQILHDKGDERAGLFYELAVALSPLDYPTANDYGCYLMDFGQNELFESWSTLCMALNPEEFSEKEEVNA